MKTPKPKAKILIPEAETKAPKDELWGGIQVVDLKKGSGPECERGNNVGRKVESLSSSSLSKTKSSRARMWECGHCWCGWRRMKAANSSEACLRETGSSARYYSPLHSIHPSVWQRMSICKIRSWEFEQKILTPCIFFRERGARTCTWTSSCSCSYCTSPPRCDEARSKHIGGVEERGGHQRSGRQGNGWGGEA